MKLTCKFKLIGLNTRLYTVNWWRGKDQFYTYKMNNYKNKNAYSFRGINVDVSIHLIFIFYFIIFNTSENPTIVQNHEYFKNYLVEYGITYNLKILNII